MQEDKTLMCTHWDSRAIFVQKLDFVLTLAKSDICFFTLKSAVVKSVKYNVSFILLEFMDKKLLSASV